MSASVAAGDPSPATIAWARRALGCRDVLAVTPLRVSSTAVHELRAALHGGGEARFVLRRFVDSGRLGTDPWYVPRHEAAALELLESAAAADRAALPVPRLLAADVDGRECDAPALLTTLLPGRSAEDAARPLSEPMLAQLSGSLAVLHAVGGPGLAALPSYEPYSPLEAVRLPSWADRPLWERALEILDGTPPPPAGAVLIHRDYHPGNTLWCDRTLTGVVDWTTACLGPAAIDLARMRQNLARLHGPDAAGQFLRVHARETGRGHDRHPWWDLRDAVDMLPDTPPPRDAAGARCRARWEAYVARVASEL